MKQLRNLLEYNIKIKQNSMNIPSPCQSKLGELHLQQNELCAYGLQPGSTFPPVHNSLYDSGT